MLQQQMYIMNKYLYYNYINFNNFMCYIKYYRFCISLNNMQVLINCACINKLS